MHTILKNRIYIAFVILLAVILALPLALSSKVAFAVGGEGDAFEVVYPAENYFQSQTPTLVAANQNYLIVLDAPENRLYVRDESLSTRFYDVSSVLTPAAMAADCAGDAPSQKPVAGIYAVGAHALIAVGAQPDLEIYSIDLTQVEATPEKKDVSSPNNIYCFASDGEKLYAKNVAGYVTSYDENMAIDKQNIYNEEVTPGQANIAVGDGVIYLFTTDQKNVAQLYEYDCNSDEILLQTESKFVQSAYIGDVIYAQISPSEDIENHSKIICLDKDTGDELYTSNFMPESFCAYGDKLYSISNGSVTGYRFKQTDEDDGVKYVLEPEEIISMAGSDFKHLDSPEDAICAGDTLVIADGDNMRLAAVSLFDTSAPLVPYPLEARPIRLAYMSEKVYALLENGHIASFNAQDGALENATILNAPEDDDPIMFEDILCFNNDLYAMTADSLYLSISNFFLPVAQLDGAKRMTAADGGTSLYVLTDDEILMFDSDIDRLPSKLNGEFQGATDIAADYAGNLFVMFEDKVESYKNNIISLEKVSETALTSAVCKATASSCALYGGSLYFSAQECFIGKLNVDAVDKEGYIAPALPAPTDKTGYHFARLKEDVNSYFIPASDGRADSAFPANSNVLLVLDGVDAPAEGASYALDSNKLYIIRDADFDAVLPTALEDKTYRVKGSAVASLIPYFEDLTQTLEADTSGIRAVSDCAGYDNGKWWLVSFDDEIYFIDPALLEESVSPPPTDDPDSPSGAKAVYGRAKAGRVGGTVNIYSDAAESEALLSVVDGKKVQILATLDGYYKVKYGDTIGYMRASEVRIGGLTTVQIVAIVLSIVVLIAGTGIFVSIYGIKKRNDAGEEESR